MQCPALLSSSLPCQHDLLCLLHMYWVGCILAPTQYIPRLSCNTIQGKELRSHTVCKTIFCCGIQVVQALHGCFQNDTISFLDEARFHRLLPLLVQQLSMQPPADLAAVLVAQQAAASSSAAQHVDAADNPASSDVFGDAVVAALVQMAVTANNDTLWKPLNHQVTLVAFKEPQPDRQT